MLPEYPLNIFLNTALAYSVNLPWLSVKLTLYIFPFLSITIGCSKLACLKVYPFNISMIGFLLTDNVISLMNAPTYLPNKNLN